MIVRIFFRHIREGFKNIKRNGWMTFASVSAVTVTLLLVGALLALLFNLNEIAKKFENEVQIKVYVAAEVTEEQRLKLGDLITDIPEVEAVEFRTKDEEFDLLIDSLGDPTAFEVLKNENPLYDSYIVETKQPMDTGSVAERLKSFPYVDDVVYGQQYVNKLFNIIEISRNIGLAIIAALLLTAMFLIANTIKMSIFARETEIEIMKLVGASNSFVKGPLYLEGLLLGILGSLVPIASILTGYHYLYQMTAPKLQIVSIQLLPLEPYGMYLAIVLLSIGGLIGFWGSFVSVRKFLRRYV